MVAYFLADNFVACQIMISTCQNFMLTCHLVRVLAQLMPFRKQQNYLTSRQSI